MNGVDSSLHLNKISCFDSNILHSHLVVLQIVRLEKQVKKHGHLLSYTYVRIWCK